MKRFGDNLKVVVIDIEVDGGDGGMFSLLGARFKVILATAATGKHEQVLTNYEPPAKKLSARGRIQQVSYCMANCALALHCTCPRDSSNKYANAQLVIQ